MRLTAAYALDVVAGDPVWFPHPVRLFGELIDAESAGLKRFRRDAVSEMLAGAVLTGGVVSIAWLTGLPKHRVWQVMLAWTTLATRSC